MAGALPTADQKLIMAKWSGLLACLFCCHWRVGLEQWFGANVLLEWNENWRGSDEGVWENSCSIL